MRSCPASPPRAWAPLTRPRPRRMRLRHSFRLRLRRAPPRTRRPLPTAASTSRVIQSARAPPPRPPLAWHSTQSSARLRVGSPPSRAPTTPSAPRPRGSSASSAHSLTSNKRSLSSPTVPSAFTAVMPSRTRASASPSRLSPPPQPSSPSPHAARRGPSQSCVALSACAARVSCLTQLSAAAPSRTRRSPYPRLARPRRRHSISRPARRSTRSCALSRPARRGPSRSSPTASRAPSTLRARVRPRPLPSTGGRSSPRSTRSQTPSCRARGRRGHSCLMRWGGLPRATRRAQSVHCPSAVRRRPRRRLPRCRIA